MNVRINKTLCAAVLLRTIIFIIIAFLYIKFLGLVETLAGQIGVGQEIVHYGADGAYTTRMNGVSESGWLAMLYYFIAAIMIPALIISLSSTKCGKPLGKLIKPVERDSITQQEYWHTMTFLHFLIAMAAFAAVVIIDILAFPVSALMRVQTEALQSALAMAAIISALFSIARTKRNKSSVILTLAACAAALGGYLMSVPVVSPPISLLLNTWLYIAAAFVIVIALRAFSKYPYRFNNGASVAAIAMLLAWILRGNFSLGYFVAVRQLIFS